jgi:hypothetical protein
MSLQVAMTPVTLDEIIIEKPHGSTEEEIYENRADH